LLAGATDVEQRPLPRGRSAVHELQPLPAMNRSAGAPQGCCIVSRDYDTGSLPDGTGSGLAGGPSAPGGNVQMMPHADSLPNGGENFRTLPRATRAAIAAIAVVAWFVTQRLLDIRGLPPGIGDGLHRLLAPANAWLLAQPRATDALLVLTSGLIDAFGCFLLLWGILGPTVRPMLGLMLLFLLRQVSQALVALPPPEGMIWRYPGVPTLFVTYGTRNDFFFSGHTGIAVYGAIELARFRRGWLTIAGAAVAALEAATVLALRAHYTMDVFAAVLAAACAAGLAARWAPRCDRALGGPGR